MARKLLNPKDHPVGTRVLCSRSEWNNTDMHEFVVLEWSLSFQVKVRPPEPGIVHWLGSRPYVVEVLG